jgi:hypothetical protein
MFLPWKSARYNTVHVVMDRGLLLSPDHVSAEGCQVQFGNISIGLG